MNTRISQSFERKAGTFLLVALAGLAVAIAGCTGKQQPARYSQRSDADVKWLSGAKGPPTPRTLLSMARILASQGRDAETAFVLKKIIEDQPAFLPAYIEMAELHMRARRVDSAIEALAAGLKMSPKDPILLNNIGMCCLVKQDYKRALETFSRAVAAEPGDVRYRANVALALGMLGRYDEALSLYKQVLEPGDAHYNLSVVCAARKDTDRAAQERAKAQELWAAAKANDPRPAKPLKVETAKPPAMEK